MKTCEFKCDRCGETIEGKKLFYADSSWASNKRDHYGNRNTAGTSIRDLCTQCAKSWNKMIKEWLNVSEVTDEKD